MCVIRDACCSWHVLENALCDYTHEVVICQHLFYELWFSQMCSVYRCSSGQVFWLSWRNRGICRPGATSHSSRLPAGATLPAKPSKKGRWGHFNCFKSVSSIKLFLRIKINQSKWARVVVRYFDYWAVFEARALCCECTTICCRICPSGLHQDFIRATYNKSHRLYPHLADNIQSDCLLGHSASRSALHHGWIDPSKHPLSPPPSPVKIHIIVFLWRRANENQ